MLAIVQLALGLGLFRWAATCADLYGGGLDANGCHYDVKAVVIAATEGHSLDNLDTTQQMAIRHWFDVSHGEGAFHRLRSMLDDTRFTFQQIGSRFGLTRQRIAQLAKELGINARQRQRG